LAGGRYFQITYQGGNGNDVVLTDVLAQPIIASITVNDGNVQRSQVWSITVTYTGIVAFSGNAADAFELDHVSDPVNGTFGTPRAVTLSAIVGDDGNGHTTVRLTFSGSETDPFSYSGSNGPYSLPILGPSLADGRYKLHSGDFATPDETSYAPNALHLYRLYGDANGDGVVNSTDRDMFSAAFNSNSTETDTYKLYLDANDDGAIDSTDLGQFRVRFNGRSVFV